MADESHVSNDHNDIKTGNGQRAANELWVGSDEGINAGPRDFPHARRLATGILPIRPCLETLKRTGADHHGRRDEYGSGVHDNQEKTKAGRDPYGDRKTEKSPEDGNELRTFQPKQEHIKGKQ